MKENCCISQPYITDEGANKLSSGSSEHRAERAARLARGSGLGVPSPTTTLKRAPLIGVKIIIPIITLIIPKLPTTTFYTSTKLDHYSIASKDDISLQKCCYFYSLTFCFIKKLFKRSQFQQILIYFRQKENSITYFVWEKKILLGRLGHFHTYLTAIHYINSDCNKSCVIISRFVSIHHKIVQYWKELMWIISLTKWWFTNTVVFVNSWYYCCKYYYVRYMCALKLLLSSM